MAWRSGRRMGCPKRYAVGHGRLTPHDGHCRVARAQEGRPMSSRKIESHPLRYGAGGNYFLPIAVACYVAFWIALAIRPLDHGDWRLESILLLAAAAARVPSYWRFRLSNL